MNKSSKPLQYFLPNKKPVYLDFEGGRISSDGGAVLLEKVDSRLGLTRQLTACLKDKRNPEMT